MARQACGQGVRLGPEIRYFCRRNNGGREQDVGRRNEHKLSLLSQGKVMAHSSAAARSGRWSSAITLIMPTMLAFIASRSSAGIQYSVHTWGAQIILIPNEPDRCGRSGVCFGALQPLRQDRLGHLPAAFLGSVSSMYACRGTL